jgi:hypothetical protein
MQQMEMCLNYFRQNAADPGPPILLDYLPRRMRPVFAPEPDEGGGVLKETASRSRSSP